MDATYLYLNELIKTTASVPGWASNHSASNNDLVVQQTRLKLVEHASSVSAPRVWNELLTEPVNSRLLQTLCHLNWNWELICSRLLVFNNNNLLYATELNSQRLCNGPPASLYGGKTDSVLILLLLLLSKRVYRLGSAIYCRWKAWVCVMKVYVMTFLYSWYRCSLLTFT